MAWAALSVANTNVFPAGSIRILKFQVMLPMHHQHKMLQNDSSLAFFFGTSSEMLGDVL